MSLQLKAICLYNTRGNSRLLSFRLGKLNIITGLSKRGKSGIIDIIDYCMGRSTYSVFEGVNRGVVSWYGIILSNGKNDIFIAKPEPEIGAKSQSGAYFKVGSFDNAIPYEQLKTSVNDTFVRAELSKILGFETDKVFFSQNSSKTDFEISIKHSKFFIFQEQGEIANKRVLFHRQADEGVAGGIRDSLPVILGATRPDHLFLLDELRNKKRKLKLLEKDLFERRAIVSGPSQRAENIVTQLIDVGVLTSDALRQDAREALKDSLKWRPTSFEIPYEESLDKFQADLNSQYELLNETLEERNRVKEYLKNFTGFTDELESQRRRLEPIGLIAPQEELSCPLCGTYNELASQEVSDVRLILTTLKDELEGVELERPKLEGYLREIQNEISKLRTHIRRKENTISAMVDERNDALGIRDQQFSAARLIGKAALYLESTYDESGGIEQVESQKNGLEREIEGLENKVDLDAIRARTDAILSNINIAIRKYARIFQHEYCEFPFKLDIQELTLKVQTLEQEIPMLRQGSGENYLACHLSTMLALHDYFIKANRPVPRFMVLDQPSQVHFPREEVFYDVTQERTKNITTDPEISAVKRDLKGLHDACEEHNGQLQIIVLEHASFPDKFFKDALVEKPWIGKGGLVPESWLDE